MQRTLGPDHRITLSAGNLLANCLLRSGDLEGAEECAADVFRGRIVRLGGRHPHTIAICCDLARILATSGKQHEAVLLARKVLPVAMDALGDEHRFTLELREVCGVTDESTPVRPEGRDS
ncbi:tetratricopeptide repeat protein [Streptomyces sp. NPDC048392]|uniref:tetratricopeptide repeat protein n=1 Tax=Streptomyces sp. NPDC048392 TaxID=3365543 RepID=UPI0037153E9C